MTAHASDFDPEQVRPGDIVVAGERRGVIQPERSWSEDHVLVDWSGATAPRLGANTWILNT